MGTIGSRLLAAIAAVTLLIVVAPEEAATGEPTWNVASGCTESQRISDSDATCMSASYSNSWSISGGGYHYSVETECGDYGTVVVHANRVDHVDYMANFTADNPESSGHASTKFRAFTCCLDQSDLCYKNQVEARSDGNIRSITINGSTITGTFVDVSSHQKRYDFCSENEDDIYCEVDPQGDANTDPNAECNEDTDPPCNCGDHYCKVADCNSHWDQSPAADTCADASWNNESAYTMTISATDGSSQTCNMTVQCMTGGVRDDGVHAEWSDGLTWSASVENFDDLRNCEGTLEDGSCANDNEVTRNAAGTVVVNGN